MSSNSCTTWGFFYLRQIYLQRRTTGTQDGSDATVFFELHHLDTSYATRVEIKKSIVDNAIVTFNQICTEQISLSSSSRREPLFCIITGFSTSVRLDTDNIGELSDFRQSVLAASMFIVPSTEYNIPERITNRSLARMDSFDFVDRPNQGPNSYRVNLHGRTSVSFTPNTGENRRDQSQNQAVDEEEEDDDEEDDEHNEGTRNYEEVTEDEEEEQNDNDNDENGAQTTREPSPTTRASSETRDTAYAQKKRRINTGNSKVQVVIFTTDDEEESELDLNAFNNNDAHSDSGSDSMDSIDRLIYGNPSENNDSAKDADANPQPESSTSASKRKRVSSKGKERAD